MVHADETPVALLAPGRSKTKKAYVWVYRTTYFVAPRAVLFDFCTSRGGEHPQRALQDFRGTLVSDDYSGYHRLQREGAITGALCMAHARRKLFEAHQLNGSEIAAQAVALIARLYYLNDGDVPIDNNAEENAIRPISVGRKNGLFVGSQQAGERAAVVLSLIESAKLNGHDPWAYLKDVFERQPTLKDRDLASLLPHNWTPGEKVAAPVLPAACTAAPASVEPTAAR